MSLNSPFLSCPAYPARPNSFPAVLGMAVGITKQVRSGFSSGGGKDTVWGFGSNKGPVSTNTSNSLDYFHPSQRKLPLNFKEIFKRIAEMKWCSNIVCILLIDLARLNNEKGTKALWMFSVTSS